MRLDILTYLLDINETHSITQTADKHFISHQALSKAIHSLEKELKLTLLIRSQHGVTFTPAGVRFLEFAETVLREKESLDKDLAQFHADYAPIKAEPLSVYAIPRYFTPQFLDLLHILQNTGRQKFNIQLHNATNADIFAKIPFDAYTIGLAVNYDLQMAESLDEFLAKQNLCYEVLADIPLYYCVHKNSPMAKSGTINEAECKFVGFNFTSYAPMPTYFSSAYTVDNFELQKKFLKGKNCFGRYTRQEYDTFFAKDFVLLEEKVTTLSFITVYAPIHDNTIDLFIKRFKDSNCLQ